MALQNEVGGFMESHSHEAHVEKMETRVLRSPVYKFNRKPSPWLFLCPTGLALSERSESKGNGDNTKPNQKVSETSVSACFLAGMWIFYSCKIPLTEASGDPPFPCGRKSLCTGVLIGKSFSGTAYQAGHFFLFAFFFEAQISQ